MKWQVRVILKKNTSNTSFLLSWRTFVITFQIHDHFPAKKSITKLKMTNKFWQNKGKIFEEKTREISGWKSWKIGKILNATWSKNVTTWKKSADLFCAIKTKFVAWFSHGCLENELWKNREKFQKLSKKWKSVEEKQKI